jgi:hypothetical protein
LNKIIKDTEAIMHEKDFFDKTQKK